MLKKLTIWNEHCWKNSVTGNIIAFLMLHNLELHEVNIQFLSS